MNYLIMRQSLHIFVIILLIVAVIVSWNQHKVINFNKVQCKTLQTSNESKETTIYISSLCNCNKETVTDNESVHLVSTAFKWCSPESSMRGMHQFVIAYTLYGNVHNDTVAQRYFSMSILRNISLTAEKLYPGWIVRIYHNIRDQEGAEKDAHNQLCDIYCQFHNVDLCSVPNMVDRIGNKTTPIEAGLLAGLNPKMFRYLAMLDRNVDVFISRDIDSIIWQREVDAVSEWLKSNFTFHAMRDHDFHATIILAGMWGAKIYKRRDVIEGLMRDLLISGQDQYVGQDQSSLETIVWPTAKFDVLPQTVFPEKYCPHN
ncbi:uncharacterized protein LOC124200379 isoform X2 [Daphnia pulex]|uniref:uncharacterized protein LOC124200379 isoform X2 n=1 Tax=Daphnia pulex TaxID=6669 RepID=UPI001EDE7C73|nr:uncharacterized protein LOC124200379 isoform X2 [Daphnia pulex]